MKHRFLSINSLKEYLIDLLQVGGFPLVLMGIGILIYTYPFTDSAEVTQQLISGLLFSFGFLLLIYNAILAHLKWKKEAEIIANQNETVIKTICKIAESSTQDVLVKKCESLREIIHDVSIVNCEHKKLEGKNEKK